jgi:hypothetical protein
MRQHAVFKTPRSAGERRAECSSSAPYILGKSVDRGVTQFSKAPFCASLPLFEVELFWLLPQDNRALDDSEFHLRFWAKSKPQADLLRNRNPSAFADFHVLSMNRNSYLVQPDRARCCSCTLEMWPSPADMRIAIVSDIHGNRTAFEAVLADLRQTAPDLILHGGDLADGGASPAEIVDHIRDLGWQGVVGNADEALFRPESLEEFANQSSAPPSLWAAVREMAVVTREALGDERIAWLRALPRLQIHGPMALAHASPESPWRAPGPECTDAELETVYSPLGCRLPSMDISIVHTFAVFPE